jgi:hypothetical protein
MAATGQQIAIIIAMPWPMPAGPPKNFSANSRRSGLVAIEGRSQS